MKLPDADNLIVAEEKCVEYVLNPQHPDGAGKSKFFALLGFRVERWDALAAALRDIGRNCAVVKKVATIYGDKYIVDGDVVGPSGRTSLVRTVWIVDRGMRTPRLVTAYPQES